MTGCLTGKGCAAGVVGLGIGVCGCATRFSLQIIHASDMEEERSQTAVFTCFRESCKESTAFVRDCKSSCSLVIVVVVVVVV